MTSEQIKSAMAEMERRQEVLDITNAEHIVLWLEANIKDSPIAWLACRIIEAHEAIVTAREASAHQKGFESGFNQGHKFGRSLGKEEGRRECAVILKGIGKINGDGFKDTTKVGEVVFVWNKELPSPYAPGLYPRVGNEVWAASREQYDFQPAAVAEVQTILHRVRREGIEEAAEYLDQFSPKLVESAAAIRALKGERT